MTHNYWRMVIYNLCCALGHAYEGWFDSSEQFTEQHEAGSLECPLCGCPDVEKKPHASAIARGQGGGEPPTYPVLQQQVRAVMQRIASVVRANTEDVGERFVTEARAIHSGEVPPRAIRGQASAEDERELRDEGVPVVRVYLPDYDA